MFHRNGHEMDTISDADDVMISFLCVLLIFCFVSLYDRFMEIDCADEESARYSRTIE